MKESASPFPARRINSLTPMRTNLFWTALFLSFELLAGAATTITPTPLPVSSGVGIGYAGSLLTGTGGEQTNYNLQARHGHRWINGFTNVSIRSITGGTTNTSQFPTITITNGSGSNRTLEFSAVTNAWKWSFAQSSTAPSVITNGTRLDLSFHVSGTNVLGAFSYSSWP